MCWASVLRESMRPVVIGVVVGLAAAAGVSRILVAFLFGLSALDPVTFLGVAAFLIGGGAAGWIHPRAARDEGRSHGGSAV